MKKLTAIVKKMYFLLTILALIGLVLTSCNNIPKELAQNQKLWESYNISDYSFHLQVGTGFRPPRTADVIVTVHDGVATRYKVVGEPSNPILEHITPNDTFGELFELLRQAYGEPGNEVYVTYDPTYGFPTWFAYYLIENPMGPEFALTISDFTPLNEAIVQVWESDELVATGVVVGNGSQVLTVLNYEVDTPGSLELSVISPRYGEYEVSVQVIDSRTGATLLRIEGGSLPVATIGDIQSLLPDQQVLIWEWYSSAINNGKPKFMETPVLYGTTQDDLPVIFGVNFPPEAMPEGIHAIRQGAVVTDENGSVLGLVGVDYRKLFPHPTPLGAIPGVASIDGALEMLSSNANQRPWSNGPLLFDIESNSVSRFTRGTLSDYERITIALQEMLGKMGEPIPSAELPQDYYEMLRAPLPTGEGILTVVYASPVDLRNTDGTLVARAKWVGFMYNTERRPFTLLYGSGQLVIEGGFIFLGDLDDIREIVPPMYQ